MIGKLLEQLIQIPSAFPNEKKISEFIFDFLKNSGGKVTKQSFSEDRANILYETGSGPALLLISHMDTVPLTGSWKTDPYKLTQKRDHLYGLGAWDMKAGLAIVLANIKRFRPESYKLKVAFVSDEENYSVGTEYLLKSKWLKDAVACMSLEPGFIHGEKGICLGRIGRSVYDVNFSIKGGHTYLARDGDNAIENAVKFLNGIKKLKRNIHPDLGASNLFPRSIYSDIEAMSIPDIVHLQIEANTVPPETTDSVLNELIVVVKTENIRGVVIKPTKRPTSFCQPYVVDKKNSFVRKISDSLRKVINEEPVYYYRNSVADDNRIATLGIPVVTVGPNGGNAHKPDEWVSEKSILRISQFLKRLLLEYNKA